MTTETRYYCKVTGELICDDVIYMDQDTGQLKCMKHDRVILIHKPRLLE